MRQRIQVQVKIILNKTQINPGNGNDTTGRETQTHTTAIKKQQPTKTALANTCFSDTYKWKGLL